MPLTIASAHLGDEAFLAAFETCQLPLAHFRHGDHLRLAWLYLHRQPFPQALASVHQAIRRFAAFHGVSHIFHETLTTAWVSLLSTHDEATFAVFIAVNEHRLTPALLHRFWAPETLASEAARVAWLPPDRAPLPF